MKFSIRDLLWLTALAALAISWWIDNKRIETAVTARDHERANLANDRRLLKEEFDDKAAVLDDLQRKAQAEVLGRITTRRPKQFP